MVGTGAAYPPGERVCLRQRVSVRGPDLGDEVLKVSVCLLEQPLTAQFGLHRPLQKLRRWQSTVLHGAVQVVGKVHLNPWHTPSIRLRHSCQAVSPLTY